MQFASNLLSYVCKFRRKLNRRRTVDSGDNGEVSWIEPSKSRVCQILNEMSHSTDEELEIIRLRILHDCVPRYAQKRSEEESQDYKDKIECLIAKNRYLQIRPSKYTLADGSVISIVAYDVDE